MFKYSGPREFSRSAPQRGPFIRCVIPCRNTAKGLYLRSLSLGRARLAFPALRCQLEWHPEVAWSAMLRQWFIIASEQCADITVELRPRASLGRPVLHCANPDSPYLTPTYVISLTLKRRAHRRSFESPLGQPYVRAHNMQGRSRARTKL